MSDSLKYPLVAILLAPEESMWLAALREEKQITIRQGHRDYRPGTTGILCCHIMGIAVMMDVVDVRHCRLAELTEDELRDDGFLDHRDCRDQMRRFYPDMDFDSKVTVIRWNNIRGGAVDDYRARCEQEEV